MSRFKGLWGKHNTVVGNTTWSLQVTGSVVLPQNNLCCKFHVITWPKVESSSNDLSNHFNWSVHLEQKGSNLLHSSIPQMTEIFINTDMRTSKCHTVIAISTRSYRLPQPKPSVQLTYSSSFLPRPHHCYRTPCCAIK